MTDIRRLKLPKKRANKGSFARLKRAPTTDASFDILQPHLTTLQMQIDALNKDVGNLALNTGSGSMQVQPQIPCKIGESSDTDGVYPLLSFKNIPNDCDRLRIYLIRQSLNKKLSSDATDQAAIDRAKKEKQETYYDIDVPEDAASSGFFDTKVGPLKVRHGTDSEQNHIQILRLKAYSGKQLISKNPMMNPFAVVPPISALPTSPHIFPALTVDAGPLDYFTIGVTLNGPSAPSSALIVCNRVMLEAGAYIAKVTFKVTADSGNTGAPTDKTFADVGFNEAYVHLQLLNADGTVSSNSTGTETSSDPHTFGGAITDLTATYKLIDAVLPVGSYFRWNKSTLKNGVHHFSNMPGSPVTFYAGGVVDLNTAGFSVTGKLVYKNPAHSFVDITVKQSGSTIIPCASSAVLFKRIMILESEDQKNGYPLSSYKEIKKVVVLDREDALLPGATVTFRRKIPHQARKAYQYIIRIVGFGSPAPTKDSAPLPLDTSLGASPPNPDVLDLVLNVMDGDRAHNRALVGFRLWISLEAQQFVLHAGALPSGTGTVSVGAGSNQVLGVGTTFTDGTIKVGHLITIPNSTGGEQRQIASIVDDTHLTTATNFTSTKPAGSTWGYLPTFRSLGVDTGVVKLLRIKNSDGDPSATGDPTNPKHNKHKHMVIPDSDLDSTSTILNDDTFHLGKAYSWFGVTLKGGGIPGTSPEPNASPVTFFAGFGAAGSFDPTRLTNLSLSVFRLNNKHSRMLMKYDQPSPGTTNQPPVLIQSFDFFQKLPTDTFYDEIHSRPARLKAGWSSNLSVGDLPSPPNTILHKECHYKTHHPPEVNGIKYYGIIRVEGGGVAFVPPVEAGRNGTVSVSAGSNGVLGTGTSFVSGDIEKLIVIGSEVRTIKGVSNSTSIIVDSAWQSAYTGVSYKIFSPVTDSNTGNDAPTVLPSSPSNFLIIENIIVGEPTGAIARVTLRIFAAVGNTTTSGTKWQDIPVDAAFAVVVETGNSPTGPQSERYKEGGNITDISAYYVDVTFRLPAGLNYMWRLNMSVHAGQAIKTPIADVWFVGGGVLGTVGLPEIINAALSYIPILRKSGKNDGRHIGARLDFSNGNPTSGPGTVTSANGQTRITGVGTSFTLLKPGWSIMVGTLPLGFTSIIGSITSDTILDLVAAAPRIQAGVSYKYFYAIPLKRVYFNKYVGTPLVSAIDIQDKRLLDDPAYQVAGTVPSITKTIQHPPNQPVVIEAVIVALGGNTKTITGSTFTSAAEQLFEDDTPPSGTASMVLRWRPNALRVNFSLSLVNQMNTHTRNRLLFFFVVGANADPGMAWLWNPTTRKILHVGYISPLNPPNLLTGIGYDAYGVDLNKSGIATYNNMIPTSTGLSETELDDTDFVSHTLWNLINTNGGTLYANLYTYNMSGGVESGTQLVISQAITITSGWNIAMSQ